jgi:hypothetical protein
MYYSKNQILSFDLKNQTHTQEVNAGGWNYFYAPGTYYSKNQILSFGLENHLQNIM